MGKWPARTGYAERAKWRTVTLWRTSTGSRSTEVEFPSEASARKAVRRALRSPEVVIEILLYNGGKCHGCLRPDNPTLSFGFDSQDQGN